MVLGSGAQHGGAADIDVLDGICVLNAGLGDGGLEGIEVDDDHVDHLDAVRLGVAHVRLEVPAAEQAAVDLGVQGLDAAVHHLGKAGELVDHGDRDAGLLQNAGSAAGRDDLDAELVHQRAGEVLAASLIGEGDNRSLDLGISHRGPFHRFDTGMPQR